MPELPDSYPGQDASILAFGDRWELITPNDDADLSQRYKYVVCGATPGAVACVDRNGTDGTFYLVAGQTLPVRPTRIKATGTVATPLYGIP